MVKIRYYFKIKCRTSARALFQAWRTTHREKSNKDALNTKTGTRGKDFKGIQDVIRGGVRERTCRCLDTTLTMDFVSQFSLRIAISGKLDRYWIFSPCQLRQ